MLVPAEHLSEEGVSPAFRAFARATGALSGSALDLLGAGLRLYLQRGRELRERGVRWPIPRLRHVAVVREPEGVHPLAQLLNEAAWTLHLCDLDADSSHPELVGALLALGDWMTATGEVGLVPLRGAAWWLLRSDAECEAFTRAASNSQRPDGEAWRALAAALAWLRGLQHPALQPAALASGGTEVPGTGLLVPDEHVARPAGLIRSFQRASQTAVEQFARRHRAPAETAVGDLLAWLSTSAPKLAVVSEGAGVLYDAAVPEETGDLRAALRGADLVAAEGLRRELEIIDERTRLFLSACEDPAALWAGAAPPLEPGGYAYLDPERRVLTLRLDEPGMDRLHGPPLPFAHAMLGARCLHEWAHLADHAGFVPLAVSAVEHAAREAELAEAFARLVREASRPLRTELEGELETLGIPLGTPGESLVALLESRLPDHRANRLLARLATPLEGEVYARHNVRSLGRHHGPGSRLRLLLRYLHEVQYLAPSLGLCAIEDPMAVFLALTGADIELGLEDGPGRDAFRALSEQVAALYACWEVDETRFQPSRS